MFQALETGRKVIVLGRNSSKLKVPNGSGGEISGSEFIKNNDKLQFVHGSVTDTGDVEQTFDRDSAISSVIVVLGGRTKDVGYTMLTDGTTNIIKSMIKRNISRIVIVTSIGCGDSMKQAPWSFKLLMWTVMRNIMSDKNNQEQLFTAADGIGTSLE